MQPISLEVVRVKIPCTVSWDSMRGDDRVRFCGECNLHVHNVSALSEGEIAALVEKTHGRICVSYFERPDGTIITEKCPRALRAIRNSYRWMAARAATWAGLAVSLASGCKPPLLQSLPASQSTVTASRRAPASRLSKRQIELIRKMGYISGDVQPASTAIAGVNNG